MKKILLGAGIFLLLMVAAVVTVPFIYKGRLIEIVKKEANKGLNAKVNFNNDIRLKILKSFPDLTLVIKDVSVINKEPFKGDTLLFVKNLDVTLDIMSVIKGGVIKIHSFTIDNSKINIHVLTDGKANYDITLPDTVPVAKPEDTSSAYHLSLKSYSVKNSTLVYKDEASKLYIELDDFNHSGSGSLTEDIYDLKTKTTAEVVTFNTGGIDYLSKVKTDLDAVINMNLKEMKFTFKDNLLKLNEFYLKFTGWLSMPKDDIDMNFTFDAPQTDFKNLVSLIPAIYSKDFKDINTSGKMSFSGSMKGIYNDKSFPGFNVNMLVSNGMFKYPSLPASVNNINFDLKVDCPDGVFDHTLIDMKKLHLELDKEPFDARLYMKTPVSDPYLDANVKGKVDLGAVKNFIPLEKGTTISGLLNADIAMKGNLSVIDKKQYEKFLATGSLVFSNLLYSSPDLPKEVRVPSMKLDFSPKTVSLQNMNASIGNSDIRASGNLDNFLAYFFGKGVMKGNLNLNSSNLDLNALLGSSSTTTTTDTSVSITAPALPGNIDFTMTSTMNHLVYDKIDAKNVNCLLVLKDKILTIKNLSMNIFNGTMQVSNGIYNTVNPEKPKVGFSIYLKNFDIAQSFNMFLTIRQFAPILKFAKGSFDARLEITTEVFKNLKPDLMSILSAGNLLIERITIEGFKPVVSMADALKMEKFKTMSMQKINPSYEIKNGILTFKPIIFKIDQSEFTVQGANGLDKSMNYDVKIKIPSKELNSQASAAILKLSQNKLNFSLGESVTVHVKMTGTIDNPKIIVSLTEIKEAVKEHIQQQAKTQVEKAKTEVEKKANEELNRQKQELEQKAKKELEEKRKKLEEEAKKKARKWF